MNEVTVYAEKRDRNSTQLGGSISGKSEPPRVEEPVAQDAAAPEKEIPTISFAQFLEATPPNQGVDILAPIAAYPGPHLLTPDLQLHCGSEHCNGTRFFSYRGKEITIGIKQVQNAFLQYTCRNCNKTIKTYAVRVAVLDEDKSGHSMKFGELPPFGPPTPSRLISLIGPDRELFLQGRRSENLGLGIGAFSYYRRVVENQKDRLFDEIIRVAEKLDSPASAVEALKAARAETQFSKAVSIVKDAIPQTLHINGHNPLTLLHSALSEGIHDLSDNECLELATSIRIVLDELSERAALALKDHAELKSAVSRLLKKRD